MPQDKPLLEDKQLLCEVCSLDPAVAGTLATALALDEAGCCLVPVCSACYTLGLEINALKDLEDL